MPIKTAEHVCTEGRWQHNPLGLFTVSEKESKGRNDSTGFQGVLAATCLTPAKHVLNSAPIVT